MSSTRSRRSSPAGRATLALGTIAFFHAAYSAYEYFSIRKSLGLVLADNALLADPSEGGLPASILLELLLALLLIAVGTLKTAQPLRQISWAAEWKGRTIDQVETRSNFMTFNHRGPFMLSEPRLAEQAVVAAKS
ncbi:hypothetical protein IE81DRAFT_344414 [Ceraceosorus guamensis]|uniref:Membrane magnesium transporter n=1 Tax=Ceraceosorus guamensis TaxID=1522189 RepID=A0A316WA51_9BASI|nr:hypothetical protein IE81DRAFT_344414 [Ceraceosorus guamensis]PWN45938.1 hypothetical protein IE81DRAFT_344414 [Ceraceosorus guamensis]